MIKNFKEVAHILRVNQGEDYVDLISFFMKNKGIGTILATKDLYFSLLDKALTKKDGEGDAFWIKKPKKITISDSILEWINDIDLEYLIQYSSKTTLRNAFGCLYKSGLLNIDEYNRIHIKYPVDGKLLSPRYAAIAILSKKKKEKLDENDSSGVQSDEEKVEDFFDNL